MQRYAYVPQNHAISSELEAEPLPTAFDFTGGRQVDKTYTLLEFDKARYARSPAALIFTRQVLPG